MGGMALSNRVLAQGEGGGDQSRPRPLYGGRPVQTLRSRWEGETVRARHSLGPHPMLALLHHAILLSSLSRGLNYPHFTEKRVKHRDIKSMAIPILSCF